MVIIKYSESLNLSGNKQTLNIILGRKLENNDISSKLTKTVFASSWNPTLKVIYMTE